MDTHINAFLIRAVTNLEGALEKQDDKLTWAVLTNLSDTIGSYITALEEKLS